MLDISIPPWSLLSVNKICFTGYSVGSVVRSLSEIREEAWHMPGFQLITWLVPQHIHVPQVYYLLLALLLGQPVKNVQNNTKVWMQTFVLLFIVLSLVGCDSTSLADTFLFFYFSFNWSLNFCSESIFKNICARFICLLEYFTWTFISIFICIKRCILIRIIY